MLRTQGTIHTPWVSPAALRPIASPCWLSTGEPDDPPVVLEAAWRKVCACVHACVCKVCACGSMRACARDRHTERERERECVWLGGWVIK